jgi:hypothetical protein
MSKTWLSVMTALFLMAGSAALLLWRSYVLGDEITGLPGTSTWMVTLEVEGDLTARDVAVITVLPLDFRHQHISKEEFKSQELQLRHPKSQTDLPRTARWERKEGVGKLGPFALAYTFRCDMGMRRPTPSMGLRTRATDGAPTSKDDKAGVSAKDLADGEIRALSLRLTDEAEGAENKAEELFRYVAREIDNEAPPANGLPLSARECMEEGKGDSLAKSRLLVALCREAKIPARLVKGLILEGRGAVPLHYWVESWVENRWLPMCPTNHHFGARRFPDNYLVLGFGDKPPVRHGSGFRLQRFRYIIEDQYNPHGVDAALKPSAVKNFFRRVSLYNLGPEEETLVKFLLLLPLAAVIISVFRTVIGIITFGTFGPALLGLSFRDLHFLPWGIAIFVLIVLAGWGIRLLLDRFHLLLVPRFSALLTIVIALLIVGILVASSYGLGVHNFIKLLPLIIITHMIERFWTVDEEDGARAAFQTLLGTVVVVATISVAVSPNAVANWMVRYPETVGFVLALQLLLGRYTGYRLTELFRFRDLVIEEPALGGNHHVDGQLAPTAREGHPGDEPAQYAMHPGPQPAPVLPPGGREAQDARIVPGDRRSDA